MKNGHYPNNCSNDSNIRIQQVPQQTHVYKTKRKSQSRRQQKQLQMIEVKSIYALKIQK